MSQYFDPSTIVLSYTAGDEQYEVTFADLQVSSDKIVDFAIIHGLAIGVGILLLFLSWIIVVNKKTPIFVMNQCLLVLLVIRSGLYLAYLTGPLSQLSYVYTGIFNGSWSGYNVTVATNVIYCLLMFSVELTMVFQVYVIFKSSRRSYLGYLLVAFSGALGSTVVGIYIYASVYSANKLRAQLKNEVFENKGSWVNNLPIILFSVTVNILSVILLSKLAMAVRTRRVLGLKRFDSFHVLMIMATQTFIVPSALVIANYRHDANNLLSSISFILAVFNLPLGSLWATSANNSTQPTSAPNTVLSRYNSSVSSQGTLANSEKPFLGKFVTPPSTDLEKNNDVSSTADDPESLERIFEAFEDPRVISVTTNGFR